MSLRNAVLTAACGLVVFASAAEARLQDYCPAVKVDKQAGRLAVYPGGAPARDKLDYAYIAVILSAEAVCREDENDNIVADVTFTYALEPGPLYQGSAPVQLSATATQGGEGTEREVTASKTSRPAKDAKAITLTVTATGLVLGDEATLEAGGYGIAGGFVKEAVAP